MTTKRFDLPRARIDGTIHIVRPRPERNPDHEMWLRRENLEFNNTTPCGREFRHSTLPDSYLTNCLECMAMDEVDILRFEVQQLKDDNGRACETIALMHAAAVGEVTGPRRGVVEDVEDLRLERDALKQQVAELEGQLSREKRQRRDDELAHMVEVDRLKRNGRHW